MLSLRRIATGIAAGTLAAFITLAAAGCAGDVRLDASQANAGSFGALNLFKGTDQPAALPDKATISDDEKLPASAGGAHNVLALSGGGSHGAFGAGFLVGWSDSGKRPAFEIVTGVSTGALIASFAFLGPAWDARMERFYTSISNEQIYTERGVEGFFTDSLYDTAPLGNLIARVVDADMLAAIAAEHHKGRRLYVATTNLDLGRVVVWDMGGIAASNHGDRLRLYRQILLSSAAVPGLFKPVYIRGTDGGSQMHVDGGVKAPILVLSFMVANRKAKRTVYVLVNGKLSLLAGMPPVAPKFKDISLRSISELMRGLFYKTIYQAYVTSRNAGSTFRMSYMPDDVPAGDPLRFETKEMKRLFEVGRKMGRTPASWHDEPPRLEDLERVKAARK